MVLSLVEDYHLVLFRTTTELTARTLGETFDEDVKLVSLVLLVLKGRHLRLQGNEFVQSVDLYLFRYVVWQML